MSINTPIFSIAKDLNVESNRILLACKKLGINAKGATKRLNEEELKKIKSYFETGKNVSDEVINLNKVKTKSSSKKIVEKGGYWNSGMFFLRKDSLINNFKNLENALNAKLGKDYPKLIAFSVKSNSNIAVINVLQKLHSGADVVSSGELKRAKKAGIKGEKIVFSGVGKTDEDLSLALDYKVLQFNVESLEELKKLSKIASEKNMIAPVAFRINPDIDAGGHEKISS